MKTYFFIIAIFFFSGLNIVFAQTATTWRGPNQSGVYEEYGLLDKWPSSGPEILWSFDGLGDGYSSPAFANNLIYLSGMEGSTGYIYALSESGKLQWKAAYGEEWDNSYEGTRASPVVAGDELYMLSGVGDLSCMNAKNGKSIWKKNLFREFGGRNIQWGINETVVIHEEKLICTPGGTGHNVIALDRHSGKLIWSSKGKGEKSAYCTPLFMKTGSRNLLVTHTERNILGIDADSGELLWNYAHTNRWSVHPNTPIFHGDQVFCFSGYGQGGVMLQLYQDGASAGKKWTSNTLDSRMGGAVVMNGKIYGSGDNNRQWQCVDWQTGKVIYASKEIGNGVVIAADGKLYLYSQRGELAMIKPGNSSFEILSETKVTLGSAQHWAHPVINKGRLFVRHGDTLISYKIK
ncbi:MAG: PQQ-like beta-propeller repeat protein [Cytophagales bacterium]|nr:PQQ-like beta-propeller repeat protein [Cytophagales bacterium]